MTDPTSSPEIVTLERKNGAGSNPPGSASKPRRELRLRVRELLTRGELVALPTETVYGIAARADDPEAIARLRHAKGRSDELALTWHVANREAVQGFASLRPIVQRLVQRYWPGPLTLVLEGVPEGCEGIAKDGWTGVRLPAHSGTRAFLEGVPFPVVMTSANLAGEPPLTDASSVAEHFGDRLALVVDGGPSRLKEASGVLRLGKGVFELLREGLLPEEDLRRVAGLRIGFVCTGNTCRSPMAEGLARDLLRERLGADPARFGFEIASMGVAAGGGSPASHHAVDVLSERGIDLSRHSSRPVRPEDVRTFDQLFCLTSSHLDALRSMVPPSLSKRLFLLAPDGRDVSDPIGGSRADYEACAASILASIERRSIDWA